MSADRIDHPGAREDYLEAVRHYRAIDEVEGTNLAAEIVDRFEIAVAEVLADPAGWSRLHYWDDEPTVFKRSVERFPFIVLFYLRDGEPFIVAYAFEGREPGYWKRRINDRT